MATEVITDRAYLENEFIPTVQNRGSAVIQARGASSAGSAANAIIDSVVSVTTPTPGDDWHSVAAVLGWLLRRARRLDLLVPTRFEGSGVKIVQDVPLSDFAKAKLQLSVGELESEKAMTADLLL